jgi:hypothetical protein
MIKLTREDWCEIYYALELKCLRVRHAGYGVEDMPGQDAAWLAHLEAIMDRIGPDGDQAASAGVDRVG